MAQPSRIVFMGSPPLAVPSLQALARCAAAQVVGVFSQPPRPVGRRGTPVPSAVQCAAEDLGLPVLTPAKSGTPEALAKLKEWHPDLIVVLAYGRILPQRVLDLPRLGPYNLHFSHLPRWRGASPLQASILAGDETTGVTLQRMVKELDAGPIAAETPPVPIRPADTAESLGQRLATAAAELIIQALPNLLQTTPALRDQDATQATHCGMVAKLDGAVFFARDTAVQIERQLRAYTPWPGLFGYLNGKRLELTRLALGTPADPLLTAHSSAPPGTLLADGWISTREGWLRILELKPEGRRPMPATAFLNGHPQVLGQQLLPQPGD